MTPTRTRRHRLIIAGAALTLGMAGLTACGESSEPAATPIPTATATATTGLPAPIIVDPGQSEVSATVGEMIVFNQPDPANTTISTDRPDVLELTQGSDDGSAVFNPGAKALATGVAVVTITAADGSTSTVTVTVS